MPQSWWLSRLAALTVLALLLSATGHAGPGKGTPPLFTGISFQQITWLEAPGVPIQSNSDWGVMSFAYKPAPKTWYLNANIKLPGSQRESWFLRNLPLAGEKNPTQMRREAVFLDLRRLGLAKGTDWKSIQAIFSLDTAPSKKAPPVASGSILPVGERNLLLSDALALGKVEPLDPGAPRPILISKIPLSLARLRLANPVRQVPGQGIAGAFARSLDWLNQTFKWVPGLSAQQIYQELLDEGVSTERDLNGNGTRLDEWLEAKDDYSSDLSDGEIETSVWNGEGLFPPVPGIHEEDQEDFLKWLKGELALDADVEIVVGLSGGGSAVFMLTEMFTDKGKTYVRFRFDPEVGDGPQGEEDVVAEIFKGADGKYRFLSDNWKILGAVSEVVDD